MMMMMMMMCAIDTTSKIDSMKIELTSWTLDLYRSDTTEHLIGGHPRLRCYAASTAHAVVPSRRHAGQS